MKCAPETECIKISEFVAQVIFKGSIASKKKATRTNEKFICILFLQMHHYAQWDKVWKNITMNKMCATEAGSSKSELAKISELKNKWIKNSKNVLLIKLFCF